MFKTVLGAASLLAAVAATGCGNSLSGTYRDAHGFLAIRFVPPHTAYIRTTTGSEVSARYEMEGDHIVLHNSGGEVTLIRQPDGSLAGSPAGPLIKANP